LFSKLGYIGLGKDRPNVLHCLNQWSSGAILWLTRFGGRVFCCTLFMSITE